MAGSCSLEQGQPLLLTAQIRSCKPAPERFWIPLRLSLPTVAPGQFPGALRFVSLALHILSQGRKAAQARFSEECFRAYSDPETRFSKAQPLLFYSVHKRPQKSRHTASLDELAEPNYYSKCLQTSSTRVFASHQAAAWKSESALNQSTETRLGWGTRGVLADSASSLYTTSFPIHSTARPACLPDAGLAMFTKRSAWVGLLRMAGGWE